MALNLSTLLTDIKAQVNVAVPGLTEITEAEHLDMIPWLDIKTPFGALVASQGTPPTDDAISLLTWDIPVQVFIVRQVAGPSSGMRADIMALVDRFEPRKHVLTAGQVMSIGSFDWSEALRCNQTFISANRAQRGGMLTVNVRVWG